MTANDPNRTPEGKPPEGCLDASWRPGAESNQGRGRLTFPTEQDDKENVFLVGHHLLILDAQRLQTPSFQVAPLMI